MRTGFRFLLSAVAAAPLLMACGPESPPARSSAPAMAPATPRADLPAPPAAAPQIPGQASEATTTYLYQCGDREVTASFHGAGDADISFDGRVLELPRQDAGTGTRYADAAGNLFWIVSEGEALLSLQGQADRRCIRPPPAFR
nr:MliC family protein [Pseudoxanthomonas sp.]